MLITPHDLSLEEIDPSRSLQISVQYFLLPDEPFPGLCRRLTIRNLSRRSLKFDVIDGLPQIIPYGAPGQLVKNMARTLEAFYDVVNIGKDLPFYKLRTLPHDKPHVIPSPQGFFYWSDAAGSGARKLGVIVHPEEVFGSNLGWTVPESFAQGRTRPSARYLGNRTPSAFTLARIAIAPGEAAEIRSIIGFARNVDELNGPVRSRLRVPGFFEAAEERNRSNIRDVTDPFLTVSGDENLDQYARQSFLDNVMRGGAPALFRADGRSQSVYIFSRKHGDLERDYNAFLVEPSFLSQGNGNFRDVHQNRRCDIYFEPGLGDENVRFFYTMIQLDGHNPLELLPERFLLPHPESFAPRIRRAAGSGSAKEIMNLLKAEYRAGDLLRLLLAGSRSSPGKKRKAAEELFSALLCRSEKRYRANFGEGYWVDHWKYGLELIESYLGVYPDRIEPLIFGPDDYTFFDSPAEVLPRSAKHVLVDGVPRQLGAVSHDRQKTALIARRGRDAQMVRTSLTSTEGESETGEPLRVNLCAKLLLLLANKIASLDPSGTGVEMSADKPGWNDSLNGLPGMFGSSTPELYEARNMAAFLVHALEARDGDCARMPIEAATFIEELSSLLDREKSALKFWDKSHDSREKFLHRVRLGVYGRKTPIPAVAAGAFLARVLKKLDAGIAILSRTRPLPPTYLVHTPVAYTVRKDNAGRVIRNPGTGHECILVTKFRRHELPLFLEGIVHACRTHPERARKIYRRVKSSPLFDRKLGMYKLSESLARESVQIGRGATFRPGWLENETVWLHMEYKYLLELLRAGCHEEFFRDWKTMGVPNLDPKVYGRSIYENSSFISSSASDDPEMRGRGFVARLSGSTAEFLHMWVLMTIGARPIRTDNGSLSLRLAPVLPGSFFTRRPREITWRGQIVRIPAHSFACAFLGKTLLLYRNPRRLDTWKNVAPSRYTLELRDGKRVVSDGAELGDTLARIVRDSGAAKIEVQLEASR